MPFSYTTDYDDANSVARKVPGNEKMAVTNADRVGRQHETAMCNSKWKELCLRCSCLCSNNHAPPQGTDD